MSGTPLPSDPIPWVGRTLSHFRVLSEIGRGGMGVVYKAEDSVLRRVVALKVLPPEFTSNEADRQRLLREARTAAALTHANIATIYEVGEASGTIFIAMELVRGEPLRDVVRRGPVPVAQALHIATEIARALARAHQAGVVHRDLKPENVMIDGEDVKLLDFGIAKVRDDLSHVSELAMTMPSPVTGRGTLVGTPEYMSPEQLRSEPPSARADVFSFGIVLYEMLTGHRPFLRGSLLETALAIWKETPTPIAELVADVPPALVAIVDRCLAKDETARFSDASEIVERLRALSGAASTGGRTAPPQPREHAAPSRAAWRVGGIAVAVALASLGVWIAVWIAARPSRARSVSVAPPSSAAASVAPLDTFDERRMSFGGEDIADVRLSPDGQTIAYSAYEPGSDVVLFTRSIRGGEAVRVPLPAAAAKPRSQSLAGYLPDGSLALLLDTAENPWTFWGVGIDGATRIVGQLRRACEWAHVSPDGTRALVMRDDGLYVESITSDVSVRLTSSGSGAQAEWSPSGDSVVYGAVDFRNVAAVDITSADGRRTHHVSDDPLIRNSVGGAALGWPEPHRLLMVVRRGTGSALVEIALDANDEPAAPPRDVYVWPDAQVQRLSSEKKNVAFIKIQVRREIYTAPLAPGLGALAVPLVPLTSDDADDTPVGWLDDHRLAFTSNREGRFALYARTTPAGSTDAVSRDVEGARVMSTGELVAWKGRRVDAGEPCALVRIDGGGEHEVFRALAADDATIACNTTLRCVRVASGSRCIALESTRDSSVWSPVDLETGKKGEPIFRSREVARNWDLSPSADTIVFTVEGTKTVNYVSIASKVLRQVRMTPEFNPQYVSYSPDGRRLVLTGMRDSGDAYVAASSDLEGHTRILATTRDAWFSAPALSPDGQQLAVAELHFPSFLGLLAPR